MGESPTAGNEQDTSRDIAAPSGWVTTQQAARALGISPRTVRWHIEQGNLEAQSDGEGVRRTWYVSIDSLQVFRNTRQVAARSPRNNPMFDEHAVIATESIGNPIRELADRLVEEAAKAAEYRVRLELTDRTQSTLEAELATERARREQAERRVAELEEQLQALPEPVESPETSSEEEYDTAAAAPYIRRWPSEWPGQDPQPEPRESSAAASDAPGSVGSTLHQEPLQRSWWQRLFGG